MRQDQVDLPLHRNAMEVKPNTGNQWVSLHDMNNQYIRTCKGYQYQWYISDEINGNIKLI